MAKKIIDFLGFEAKARYTGFWKRDVAWLENKKVFGLDSCASLHFLGERGHCSLFGELEVVDVLGPVF